MPSPRGMPSRKILMGPESRRWRRANRFGPDAEAYFTFTAVTPELLNLNYSSTRGLNTRRSRLSAMCGRLPVGKSKRHVASLVGAAMFSAVFVTLSQTERNLPTIANVDARDFSDLACWLIVQIGPISLNVTTPSSFSAILSSSRAT